MFWRIDLRDRDVENIFKAVVYAPVRSPNNDDLELYLWVEGENANIVIGKIRKHAVHVDRLFAMATHRVLVAPKATGITEHLATIEHFRAKEIGLYLDHIPEDLPTVHPSVILPVVYGPTRHGLSWARVAAGYTIYQLAANMIRSEDAVETLIALAFVVNAHLTYIEKARKLIPRRSYLAAELAEAAWTDELRPLDDVHRLENARCVLSTSCLEDTRNFKPRETEEIAEHYRFLLRPYYGSEELGRLLHVLGDLSRPVVVTATETFSPLTLHVLCTYPKEIYLIYTPNVYPQVSLALDVYKGPCKDKIRRVPASHYNPYINYLVFSRLINNNAVYTPKLTGPMPIYLALKKLEKERKLEKLS